MDRRGKERLVGATILLVLIVVVVPELLSGPKQAAPPPPLTLPVPAPMHSYTVDLADHSMAPTATVPAVAQTPPSVTASAAGAASTAATPPTATPPTGTPPTGTASTAAVPGSVPPDAVAPAKRVGASTTMPLESAAPPPTSERSEAHRAAAPVDSVAGQPHPSRGEWAVQLGSFASKANAEKLVRALSAKGHTATISAAGSGASLRYRVRMASLVDREAAERVLQRLKAQGQAATLVPPAP